jgi:SAM-dependent methyltransferase
VNKYDEVEYPNSPRIQTHPLRLGALAHLFGRPWAQFNGARILEVACGDGGNIINLAQTAPDAEVVGFDLASGPIEKGRATIAALGLRNIRLEVLDILDARSQLGEFDYIIAHGFYAWVPERVREALWRLCATSLSPVGLAFISYNALPGCHLRQILRDLLEQQVPRTLAPAERLALATRVLETYMKHWAEGAPLQRALAEDARLMLDRPAEVFFHDELGPEWHPRYLTEVVDEGRAHGLEYLCDALPWPGELLAGDSRPRVGGEMGLNPLLEHDFFVQRRFRQSIFHRGGPSPLTAAPLRLLDLFAETGLKPAASHEPGVFRFVSGDDEISTTDAAFATALATIAESHPNACSLATAGLAKPGCEALLKLVETKLVTLQTAPFPMAGTPPHRPRVSRLARWQLSQGLNELTALHHRPVRISSPELRRFLERLDGHASLEDLPRLLEADLGQQLAPHQVEDTVRQACAYGLVEG